MSAVRTSPASERTKKTNATTSVKVIGMDPSFRNWGYAVAEVDIETLEVTVSEVEVFTTEKTSARTVRRTSDDFRCAQELYGKFLEMVHRHEPAFLFSEIPAGSQSAVASKGLGIALGVLASSAVPLIQVQPQEVKLALTNSKTASKQQMMEEAHKLHPNAAGWLYRIKNNTPLLLSRMEHAADAIGAIHAGIQTQQFQDYLMVLRGMLRR